MLVEFDEGEQQANITRKLFSNVDLRISHFNGLCFPSLGTIIKGRPLDAMLCSPFKAYIRTRGCPWKDYVRPVYTCLERLSWTRTGRRTMRPDGDEDEDEDEDEKEVMEVVEDE
ncbi:hypothetical protein V1477_002448 [Vespula maculifrons]|uniref:Uncharacterized protein n=1 Tax=Vespula maculifrons TaxID=7453 RepID=A0ABD2CZD9_VESMC